MRGRLSARTRQWQARKLSWNMGFWFAVSSRALFCGRIREFFHPSGRKPHFELYRVRAVGTDDGEELGRRGVVGWLVVLEVAGDEFLSRPLIRDCEENSKWWWAVIRRS
jgi:hypothetical protein